MKMTVSDSLRWRLDIQGFFDVDSKSKARWVKFSNFMCFLGFSAGTYLQNATLMYVMALFAVAGLSFHHTPFDYLYIYGIKPVINGPDIPKRPAPARFACFIGMVWAALTGSAFLIGYNTAGIVLGVALVIASGLQGIMNYCVASQLWRKIYGWPDRDE
jgi:hypothetical protein